MFPHIIELTPFIAAGRKNRQKLPGVRHTSDVAAFWAEPQSASDDLLRDSYALFPKSKHCEIVMCCDADLGAGEFSYFAGRGVTACPSG